MDDVQMQKALKKTLLTRGRAVTLEDYRTIAKNYLGDTALKVEVKKGLGIGEWQKDDVATFVWRQK
jgi:putative transposase